MLVVNGKHLKVFVEQDSSATPSVHPMQTMCVDQLVVSLSGQSEVAEPSGATKVMISAPPKDSIPISVASVNRAAERWGGGG